MRRQLPSEIVISDTIEDAIQARKEMYAPDKLEYLDDLMQGAIEAEERFGIDYLEYESRPTSCPLCDGIGNVMGHLGNKTWLRCRQCGIEFSRESEPEPDYPIHY